MKRYFTFETPPDPTYNPRGGYHYESLEGSGYVCVLAEETAEVPPDWTELPHLLESTPANFNGINTTPGAYVALTSGVAKPAPVAIAGVTHTDTTFQIAKKLAAKNPRSPFNP